MPAALLLAVTVVAETQLYPVHEQSIGYLGRYADQPLCLDRTIDLRDNFGWGRCALGDLDTYRRWARDYGIDGFSTFTWSRPFIVRACQRSAVQGLANVHIFNPGVRTETMESSLRSAMADPNALKRDGAVVLLTFDAWRLPPARLKARYDEIRQTYGREILFVTDTPQLANHHYRNAFRADGKLTPAQETELKSHLRDYLRVSDGVYAFEQWLMQKFARGERVLDTPYYREVLRLTREVLDEPEFRGKLLALAVPNGHENHYTVGHLISSNATRTFRDAFEAAIDFRADIINLFEWDEWNENTSALPTLYNSYACKRMVRHYMSRLRGEPPQPIAGDDRTVPNLIVSYRRQLDDRENFYVEVLNVPDGTGKGTLNCSVRLTDAEGLELYGFRPRRLDTARMSEARFELPDGLLAQFPPAFRVNVAWTGMEAPSSDGKVVEGLLPVNHLDGAGWLHQCVRQPLRDLATMSRAEVALDAEGRIAADLNCTEPLRYAMLCGDGLIQYIHAPDDPVSRFRSTDETVTFAIAPFKWRAHRDAGLGYRVPGVPEAEWLLRLDAPQAIKGESVQIHEVSMWNSSHFLAIPRTRLASAVLELKLPGLIETAVPLREVTATGGWAAGGSNGFEIAVSSFGRQAAYPAAWRQKECAFAVRPDFLARSGVFYVQAVTMSGKTWRSKPVFCRQDARSGAEPTRLEYDFSPRAGDAVWPKSGERRYCGLAGGPFQLLSQFNRGATAEGPLDASVIARLAASAHDMHPQRREIAGIGWAFFFDGVDDYVGFPSGTLPSNGGFRLKFDVLPERDRDEEFILGARNGACGSLAGVTLRRGQLKLDYMGMNFQHTAFATGLKVVPRQWNHVEIVNTGNHLRATVNGKCAEHDCCRPGRGYTAFAIGGDGGDGRHWFKGGIANLVIEHL